MPDTDSDKPDLRFFLLSYGILLAVMLVWNYYAGKDLNWDGFSYHYYLPHSLVTGRLAQDFFVSTLQSYLNPVALLPFYLFNQLGLPSLVTASLLTVIHSLNYPALVLLVRTLGIFPGKRILPYFITAVLALITPVFLQVLGSSFIEAIVSAPFFFGLFFFLRSTAARDWFAAGLLLSAAVAMKFVLLLCILPLVVFLIDRRNALNRGNLSALAAGGAVGLTVFGGWWFWLIWQHFGNPVFPLFNKVFPSPLLYAENIQDYKFLPVDAFSVLILPLRMLSLEAYVYVETVSPDLRILLFFCLLPLFFIRKLISGRITLSRRQACFLIYLVLCYLLWVCFSGNGRYGLVFLILTGAGIAILLANGWGIKRFYFYAPLLIICQLSLFLWHGSYRWDPREWTQDWFDVTSIPSEYTDEPALYLSIQIQAPSFLIPDFHRDSRFVSLMGMYSIGRYSGAGQKIHHMIHSHSGDIKAIRIFQPYFLEREYQPTDEDLTEAFIRQREIFFEYDVDIVPDTCEVFDTGDSLLSTRVLICDLVKKTAPAGYWEERAHAHKIFARVEAVCPGLAATGARAIKVGASWRKYYLSHGATLLIGNDFLTASQRRTWGPVTIAPVADALTKEWQSCPLDKLEKISVPFFPPSAAR